MFAWGDAAAAGANEAARQQKQATDLQAQLADIAYRQALIRQAEAQDERLRQSMDFERQKFEFDKSQLGQQQSDQRNQQGLRMMAGDVADQYPNEPQKMVGTLIRAGIPIPSGMLSQSSQTADTQWVDGPEGLAFRVPQAGDKPHQQPTAASGPNVGSFEDYVIRRFGQSPTPQQIQQARRDYNQADDRPPAGSPGAPPRPPSQAQFTVAGYAERIAQAEPTIEAVTTAISGMPLPQFMLQSRLPAAAQSKEMQNYMQAARNLINAQLRRESGAVISDSEFAEARAQYLPQPGDDASTLELKRRNRRQILESNRRAAGSAYQGPAGAPKVGDVKTYPNGRKARYDGKGWVWMQ